MSNPNRIQSLALTPDIARQTPKNDFGDVMVQTFKTGASAASGIIGGAVAGVPVLSAAVSGLQSTLALGSGGTSANIAPGVIGAGQTAAVGTALASSGSTALAGNEGTFDVHGASKEDLLQYIQEHPDASSAAYLELQQRMAQESQQFTSISNILKVRADSAKAAINNIR